MLEAELLLRVPKNWMSEVADRFGVRVKVIDRKPYGKHGVQDLVEMEVADQDPAEIQAFIRKNPFVAKASLHSTEEGKALGAVSTRCLACRALAASNCFLVKAHTRRDGVIEWQLVVEDRPTLSALVDNLRIVGCDVNLGKLRQAEDEDALTRRQEEILRMAFERGYFDYPKGVGIRDLAAMFHVSISTISEVLRKGQKKVLSTYFSAKRGG